jgi:hypothetical protein
MIIATNKGPYQFPKKAIKVDCPNCSPRHRNSLSLYIETKTGEPLPLPYGLCDKVNSCGYYLSPYHKDSSGLSYADKQKGTYLPRNWYRLASKSKRNYISRQGAIYTLMSMEGASLEQAERVVAFIFDKPSLPNASIASKSEKAIYSIPIDVFQQSLNHYDRNQFAISLGKYLGEKAAVNLLKRFQIGTSSRWPGGCIFWYIDQQGRVRGGQIKLFDETLHTVKYVNAKGEKRSKTSWVHSSLTYRLVKVSASLPDWLIEYNKKGEYSSCLFGLPQLLIAPIDAPIAIVEAPKTAIVCTHYMPDFVWLAVGALSYLNADRLASIRGRKIMLFPDLNGFEDWTRRAKDLQAKGFQVEVSSYLENRATDEQRAKGLDLADFLLESQQQLQDINRVSVDEYIKTSIIKSLDPDPNFPNSKLQSFKIPCLIQHYWTLFSQPPFCWNRLETLRYIKEYIRPVT